MHIFLSGASGVGKSTVIAKVLSRMDVTAGGFCSGYGPDRGEPNRLLYLWDAGNNPVFADDCAVACVTAHRPHVMQGRFDSLGCAALRRARETGAELIVMDECGRLEREELRFRAEVLACLDAATPVLGVVGRGEGEWPGAIRNHPNVTVLEVTQDNRDDLPDQIFAMLKGSAAQ